MFVDDASGCAERVSGSVYAVSRFVGAISNLVGRSSVFVYGPCEFICDAAMSVNHRLNAGQAIVERR